MKHGKPVALDLYCGPGGSAKGYQQAGCYVVGVDKEPQPSYCGDEFHQEDALWVLTLLLTGEEWHGWRLEDFAFIGASPPCQLFSEGAPGRKRDDHPDLLTPTRELVKATGLPYSIENVATAPMPESVLLCGSTFDLPVIRHRRFEIHPDPVLVPSLCHQSSFSRGVKHKGRYSYGHGRWRPSWQKYVLPVVWPWMELEESGQAIPPPYTHYIAEVLLGGIGVAA